MNQKTETVRKHAGHLKIYKNETWSTHANTSLSCHCILLSVSSSRNPAIRQDREITVLWFY